MDQISVRNRNILGFIGALLLFSIIAIKLLRIFSGTSTIIGIAPSILGPPGLLFLLISDTGRFSHWSPLKTTLSVAAVAIGLELCQLLPRPGVLARIHYTFDYLDLVASILSLLVAYTLILVIIRRKLGTYRNKP